MPKITILHTIPFFLCYPFAKEDIYVCNRFLFARP